MIRPVSARLRGIAKETEEIVRAGRYTAPDGRDVPMGEALAAALAGTRMYGPGPVPVTPDTDRTTAFEDTGESSLEAARRLTGAAPGPVAVLNFASARNPGGGYLNGAQAQGGGAVAGFRAVRGPAARPRVLRPPPRRPQPVLHRPGVILPQALSSVRAGETPFAGVPVFRDDRGALLAAPYTVGFLTSPAPNAGVIRSREPDLAHRIPAALHVPGRAGPGDGRRVRLPAAGARRLGRRRLHDDPAAVAGAFHAHLTGEGRFSGHFDEVVFGVLDRTREASVRGAFRAVFAEHTTESGAVTGADLQP